MDPDEYESLPSTVSVATHMTAGALAGILEHTVMYPLDVVKTRMQSISPNPAAAYRTVPEAIVKMVQLEGACRPFRGMSVMVMGAGPAHAMYFACYEKMKRVISGTKNGRNSPVAQGAAGCLSTLLHDAVMNPADVIKQRMQVFNSPYRSVFQCLKDVYSREGFRAFYRSYGTQLTMNVPYQSIHFVIYEAMAEMTNRDHQYKPSAHMVSGAVAGAIASAITNPLDVCKTLLNTQESSTLTKCQTTQVKGLFQAANLVYSCCGLKGFTQGLQARVMYAMPSTAIAWSVYEFFKYSIHGKDDAHLNSSNLGLSSNSKEGDAISTIITTTKGNNHGSSISSIHHSHHHHPHAHLSNLHPSDNDNDSDHHLSSHHESSSPLSTPLTLSSTPSFVNNKFRT